MTYYSFDVFYFLETSPLRFITGWPNEPTPTRVGSKLLELKLVVYFWIMLSFIASALDNFKIVEFEFIFAYYELINCGTLFTFDLASHTYTFETVFTVVLSVWFNFCYLIFLSLL